MMKSLPSKTIKIDVDKDGNKYLDDWTNELGWKFIGQDEVWHKGSDRIRDIYKHKDYPKQMFIISSVNHFNTIVYDAEMTPVVECD